MSRKKLTKQRMRRSIVKDKNPYFKGGFNGLYRRNPKLGHPDLGSRCSLEKRISRRIQREHQKHLPARSDERAVQEKTGRHQER